MGKKKITSYGKPTNRGTLEKTSWMELGCKKCNRLVRVPVETGAVTCWYCVQAMVEPPKGHIDYDIETGTFRVEVKEVGIHKPRGWKAMSEFVDSDGNVYCFGQEQPHLKGSKPITLVSDIPVVERKKPTKRKKSKSPEEIEGEKQRILVKMNKLKKQLKVETDKDELNKIKNDLTKLTNRLSKL